MCTLALVSKENNQSLGQPHNPEGRGSNVARTSKNPSPRNGGAFAASLVGIFAGQASALEGLQPASDEGVQRGVCLSAVRGEPVG